jgi:hypothetical protein
MGGGGNGRVVGIFGVFHCSGTVRRMSWAEVDHERLDELAKIAPENDVDELVKLLIRPHLNLAIERFEEEGEKPFREGGGGLRLGVSEGEDATKEFIREFGEAVDVEGSREELREMRKRSARRRQGEGREAYLVVRSSLCVHVKVFPASSMGERGRETSKPSRSLPFAPSAHSSAPKLAQNE